MFVITASGDLFGFGHASMSPPPALWRDGVGAGRSPFPASATAEGGAQRVFNGAPSRGERELVAPATPGQYNALQREWGAKRPGHIAQVEQ